MAEQPTFTQWLARMTPNDTRIGELARYVESQSTWPGGNDRQAFIAYLESHALYLVKAFVLAWGLYRLAIRRGKWNA